MAVSYDNLWSLLIKKGLSEESFCNSVGITNETLKRLENNLPIHIETLSKICETLECGFDDIVRSTNEGALIINFPDFDISCLFDDLRDDNEFDVLGIKRSTDLPKPYSVKSIKATLSKYIRECKLSRAAVICFLDELKKYNVVVSIDEDVIPIYDEIPKKHSDYENSQMFKIELQQAKNYVLWLSEQDRLFNSLEELAKKSEQQFNMNDSFDLSKFVKISCEEGIIEYETAIDKIDKNNGFPFNLIYDIFGAVDLFYFRYQYPSIVEKMNEVFDTLTPREAFLLEKIYGASIALDDWYEAIGVLDNEIIKDYIMKMYLSSGLRKLRHPSRNRGIARFLFDKKDRKINLFDLNWMVCYDTELIKKTLNLSEYDHILGAYISSDTALKTKILIVSVLHNGLEKFQVFNIDCNDNIMKVDVVGINANIFDKIIVNIPISSKTGLNIDGMLIEDLELSVRSYNCLKRAGVNTLNELAVMTLDDLMNVSNLDRRCVDEVISVLIKYGLVCNSPDIIVDKEVEKESIVFFAKFYSTIFCLKNSENINSLLDKFLMQCSILDFDLKIAEWFCGIFSDSCLCLNSVEILNEICDSKILGSLILLKWQQIVDVAKEDLLLADNRIWFIVAFNCLQNVAFLERQKQELDDDLIAFDLEI